MGPIFRAGLDSAFKSLFIGCSAVSLGITVVSAIGLKGGKRMLQLQLQPNGSPRNDLTLCQKMAINIAGHALIVFGILAGVLACALFSFAVAPLIGVSLCVLVGASASATSIVFNISIIAALAFSLSGLVSETMSAYSPLCGNQIVIPPHAPQALAV